MIIINIGARGQFEFHYRKKLQKLARMHVYGRVQAESTGEDTHKCRFRRALEKRQTGINLQFFFCARARSLRAPHLSTSKTGNFRG